jgi:hypothetical protein
MSDISEGYDQGSCILVEMDSFMNNRFVQITGLTLGLALLIYIFLWIFFMLIRISVDAGVQTVVSLLGAIFIVWKFYAWRIG